jgi:hypothetical protein
MKSAYFDDLIQRWYIDDAKRVIIGKVCTTSCICLAEERKKQLIKNKGDKILENVPIKAHMSRDVSLDHDLVFQIPLWSCDCDLLREDGDAAEDACLDGRCTANNAQDDGELHLFLSPFSISLAC